MESKPAITTPVYTLSSGHSMPMIGLGTDGITDPTIIARAVTDLGYRLLDTASRYKNEHVVGQAITLAASQVKREELFVVTKVWIDEVEDVEGACRRSLEKLGLEWVDLYLLHWPVAVRTIMQEDGSEKYEKINLPVHKIWPQLEALVDLGLAKSIGVSNFNVQSLWDLQSYARTPPAANEVEIHPLYNQSPLVAYCLSQHILPVAYSSLARASNAAKKKGTANVLETELIQGLARKYSKIETQIVLNWAVVGRGYAVIPKSATFERQRDNLQGVTDFKMEESEYKRITDELHDGSKICKTYEWLFNYDLWA
ncbi:hypothetical protein FGO68_gene6488 [Halteria grandinella]|uniref:NADP-dependent oxidoreductase domain-containing protein n=1 Tax=Halteria grandinella TaxID=5974 RepID=A0A8J8NKX7_HALGN|nr:hypothetical protein FGO68_gene6488 [Halteria grandinella]